MQKCDDAMTSSFSGLSKKVRYQKQHQDDLIKKVNHPEFRARSSQGSEGKEICHNGKWAQDLDQKLNQYKGSNIR
jgi:G:T/U-mismatch repair DNA glycosylase